MDGSLIIITVGTYNGWMKMIIVRFLFVDDVARLHVEIYKINDPLVGFCFIRDIDTTCGYLSAGA
jgi:hypothetical protein